VRISEPLQLPLGLACGAVAALLLAVAPVGLSLALAIFSLLYVPSLLLLARSTFERRIFTASVALRCVLAVVIYYGGVSDFFALDPVRYERLGGELAAYWSGAQPEAPAIYGRIGYYAWNAVIYLIVGQESLAPSLANAVIGGWCVIFASRIARALSGDTAARYAAIACAFWPSLALWSSLNLKDAMAIFLILLALLSVQRVSQRPVSALAGALAATAALASIRGYMALVLLLSISLGLLLPRLARSSLLLAPAAVVALMLLPSLELFQELASEVSFEELSRTRGKLAAGASASFAEADLSTPRAALSFLPIGLTYFVLAPMPWHLLSGRQLLVLPEMLAWYGVLIWVARGAISLLRNRFRDMLPVFLFAVTASVSYAMVEGNLGTVYRHRAQVLVPFLIFAAHGFAEARGRSGSRATLEAPAVSHA
jgi:hypothetical protein